MIKQNKMQGWNLILGAALLIAGTSIGAGMLGLPIRIAEAGFIPALGMFVVVWLIMTFSALCMVEVALWFQGETNLISMATSTLGKWGGKFAWLIYLSFLYSVLSAYTSGGMTIFANIFGLNLHSFSELLFSTIMFMLPFAICVCLGTKYVDYVNRIFLAGLVLTFFLLVVWVKSDVHLTFNYVGNAKKIFLAIPLMVMSFGYHLIIPSLKTYLNNNLLYLRLAVIIGGAIPLLIYSIWIYVVLDLVPTWGEGGLLSMLSAKQNPADLLIQHLSTSAPKVALMVACFSFLALISSLIGVALGVFDFFADGLHIKKSLSGILLLCALTFIPPIVFTLWNPHGFMIALKYGSIFAVILLILYPIIMTWRGRYVLKSIRPVGAYQVLGGKPAILLVLGFAIAVILMEIIS